MRGPLQLQTDEAALGSQERGREVYFLCFLAPSRSGMDVNSSGTPRRRLYGSLVPDHFFRRVLPS